MCTALYISTGDCVVDFRTVDLYWGRPSRVMCCRSILGRCDRFVVVDLYWGRCGRKLDGRSLLGTEW